MNTKHYRYLLGFVLALWASALSAQTHWSVNPSAYQYRMTVWCMLQSNNVNVANLNNYEVAAFAGNECRGVSTVVSQESNSVYQLLIYSNKTSGETFTFKCYNKTTMEEKNVYGSTDIPFSSDGSIGLPSSPFVLTVVESTVTSGDVDGDGRITINDAVLTINATFGTDPEGFNRNAADMDGDGRVTINDAILIINQTF